MRIAIEFSANQFARLANISDNAGQVVLASAVLNPLLSGPNKFNWLVVITGFLTTVSLWIISLFFEKEASLL